MTLFDAENDARLIEIEFVAQKCTRKLALFGDIFARRENDERGASKCKISRTIFSPALFIAARYFQSDKELPDNENVFCFARE